MEGMISFSSDYNCIGHNASQVYKTPKKKLKGKKKRKAMKVLKRY